MNRPNRSLLSLVRGHNHEKEHGAQPCELNDNMSSAVRLQDLDSPLNQQMEASPTETPTKAMSIKERMGLLRMKLGSSSPKKDVHTASPTKEVKTASPKKEKKVKQEVTEPDGKRVLVAGDWDAEKKPTKGILKKVSRGDSTDTVTPSDSSNGSDESRGSSASGAGGYLSGANQPTFLSAPSTPVSSSVRLTRKSPSSSRKAAQSTSEATTPKSRARRELEDSVRSRRSPGARGRTTEKSPRKSTAAISASSNAASAEKNSPHKVQKSPATPTNRKASSQETRGRTRSSPRASPRSDTSVGKRSNSSHSPRVLKSRSDVEGMRSRSSHSPRVAPANPESDDSSRAVLKTPVRSRSSDLNASCSSMPAQPRDDSKRRTVRSHSQPRSRISRDTEASKVQKSPSQKGSPKPSIAPDEACQTPASRRRVGPSRHRSTSSSRSPRSPRSPEEQRVGSPTDNKKASPSSDPSKRGVRKTKSLDANALWRELGYKKKSPPTLTRSARARPSSSKTLDGVLATKSLVKKKAPRRDSGANSVVSVAAQLEIPSMDSDDESGMRVKYTEVESVEHTT